MYKLLLDIMPYMQIEYFPSSFIHCTLNQTCCLEVIEIKQSLNDGYFYLAPFFVAGDKNLGRGSR